MRKLKSIFKSGKKTLKIFESAKKFRGEVYENERLYKVADFFGKNMDEDNVKEYFGFNQSYKVPFERRNGKIVLFPVNKQKRIIWTNDNYDEWKECMIAEMSEGETEEDFDYERYSEDCSIYIDDERANLNVNVDGYIVAFANLGLWNGRFNGGKVIGTNVKDILSSDCDYCTWYCDPFNVKMDGSHHDGENHILYRVAENRVQAERLVEKIAYHGMTEEQFRHATKSLRPYVANVYGW